MNARLACSWVREQMVSRAAHRIAVGPERAAREEEIHDEAVAEVDGWLDPPELSAEEAAQAEIDEWLMAGGEVAA